MPRRYRRRRYAITRPIKTQKYSNETFAACPVSTFLTNNHYSTVLIAKSTVLGTRKCKNFTLSVQTNTSIPFVFALIYVPEGTNATSLGWGTAVQQGVMTSASLYEPNQNVIMQGIFGGINQPYRFKSRLARNLNSGDTIQCVIRPLADTPANTLVCLILNYALAF